MKIALCAQSNTPDSSLDSRFGRAAWFAVYNDIDGQWQFVQNQQNLQAAQGAGIQAAQYILDAGAELLIASNVGPKAVTALLAGGVQIVQAPSDLSLSRAVEKFKAGQLETLTQANVEGHWT
jgi:predicted Fe-Mo cluster-binding NifX family protein